MELARYKLDLVGVQNVRWDKEGTVKIGFFFFKGNEVLQLGTGFFTPQNLISNLQSRVY